MSVGALTLARMSAGGDPHDSGAIGWIFDGGLKDTYGYSDADLRVFARVLSRGCPRCDAKPGACCVTPKGKVLRDMDSQHVERRVRND